MNSTKVKLKRFFYRALAVLGIYRLGQFLHRRQALILTYHGVLQKGREQYVNRNCVEAAMFDRQMAYLARHYQVMALPELMLQLRAKRNLPPYTAAITFDDGFQNNFTAAWPILKKHRLPATIFLTTAYMGAAEPALWTERVDHVIHSAAIKKIRLEIDGHPKIFFLRTSTDREAASDQIRAYLKRLPLQQRENAVAALAQQADAQINGDNKEARETAKRAATEQGMLAEIEERYAFLNWQQVGTMAQDQITFGSHTHTHSILSTLSETEAHFELSESRRMIEQELGAVCNLFSYPNGSERDFGPRDKLLLDKLGYQAAVSQMNGFNDSRTDILALRRINIARHHDFNFFLAKISGVWSKLKWLM
jgi:peptidoglycan/xylan/chitin deacetylase (PgdA/CDA1 family)